MLRLKTLTLIESKAQLDSLPAGKLLINTINAHSYNTAQRDELFAEVLRNSGALLPDGASIVVMCKIMKALSRPVERVAGWDLFVYEMQRLNRRGGRCFFMGSSEEVLKAIRSRAAEQYPSIEVLTLSPPYKEEFSEEDNKIIIDKINAAEPDLLWIGMTAPKQEKWVYAHWDELNISCHIGTIGAVFDFFAGTVSRAPVWWQNHYMEWLYRLMREPRRMWRRYIIGNMLFMKNIFTEMTHPDKETQ